LYSHSNGDQPKNIHSVTNFSHSFHIATLLNALVRKSSEFRYTWV